MIGPWWVAPQSANSKHVDHDFQDDYRGSDNATCKRCGLRWKQTEFLNGGGCGATSTRNYFIAPDGTDGWRECLRRDKT